MIIINALVVTSHLLQVCIFIAAMSYGCLVELANISVMTSSCQISTSLDVGSLVY